jgi:hypothetical protein
LGQVTSGKCREYSRPQYIVLWLQWSCGDGRSGGDGPAESRWVAGGDRDRGVGVQLDMVGCRKRMDEKGKRAVSFLKEQPLSIC